jgi:hypothetical protein
MRLLAEYTSELEAQLLESRLKAADVDVKIARGDDEDGDAGPSDMIRVMVFDDDYDLAVEILEGSQMEDDDFIIGDQPIDDLDDLVGDDEL